MLGDNPLHPLRVSKRMLHLFMAAFEQLYLNEDGRGTQFEQRGCGEVGFYFIGRKK